MSTELVPPLHHGAPACSTPADDMQPHAKRRHPRPSCGPLRAEVVRSPRSGRATAGSTFNPWSCVAETLNIRLRHNGVQEAGGRGEKARGGEALVCSRLSSSLWEQWLWENEGIV
ncbi:hypothetical protein EYF80_014077 [Liparis tanakae]|uniref:Uncharacterized protein n=1 Tax=Liparis tanakae TaxID=230148 RepID=A0A4Z2IE64_9TELE|nr:hypothetical protein EYF80_014077 [Liparis tanakae]